MTSKTTNKFSPEVRARAVRMVLDHASEHPSRWAAVTSIAAKIGCTPQTLHDWVKKAEVDSGKRACLNLFGRHLRTKLQASRLACPLAIAVCSRGDYEPYRAGLGGDRQALLQQRLQQLLAHPIAPVGHRGTVQRQPVRKKSSPQ